jgi:PPOX class probable F420-dependent enzyme
VRSLLEASSPAVLTTYRKDGSAHTVPVWFRWVDDAFEVVIAKGNVKLRHLARDPRCVLVVFEAVRPFRGLEVRGVAELVEGDVTSAGRLSRAAIWAWVTASALPPNGDPGQGCCSGSSPTARGCGICRESCPGDRPRQHRRAGRCICMWLVGLPRPVLVGLEPGGRRCRWRYTSEARATAAWWPVEILAPSDEPHRDGGDVPQGRRRSFRWSFHQPLLGETGAYWLDDPPDVSCKESTRQYAVDGSPLIGK